MASPSPDAAIEILNDVTPTTGSYSGNPVLCPGSNHVEVFVVTTAGDGSITVTVSPIEAVSGTVMETYTTSALTGADTGVILLDYEGTNKIIGDSLNIAWTVSGSITGVYIRLMKKK